MTKKLVFGIGYTSNKNDIGINPKARKIWGNMLERCYKPPTEAVARNYKGCTVSLAWHDFSVFKLWYELYHIDGYFLDKDLMNYGNKVYSPENCVFVPRWLNNLLIDSTTSRGKYPIGVSEDISKAGYPSKYKARISKYGKSNYLGVFATEKEAAFAYNAAKINYLTEVLENNMQLHTQIKSTLKKVIQSLGV